MAGIDYAEAQRLLEELFEEAEAGFKRKQAPPVPRSIQRACDTLVASATQSYREALLGCCLARILDRSINIQHPYVNQGSDAFNGRTLDERVVNPFLQDRLIPSSKGPYLASFRRSVKFVPATADGLRDKDGYQAMLAVISALREADSDVCRQITTYLLTGFLQLRDASRVPLSQISRLSLEQHMELIDGMLQVHSGGLIPVLFVVAMLRTLNACFNLKWNIAFQGINVADRATGAGGDVTVQLAGEPVLAIEVTERPIDKSRVVSTFNTKVVRGGLPDYLFMYSEAAPTEEARTAARAYFSQGHEINFVRVNDWIANNLITLGSKCRQLFTRELLKLLDERAVPSSVKVSWNDLVRRLIPA